MNKKINARQSIQVAISLAAIILIMGHLLLPGITLDTATMLLIALAFIPWLVPLFKSLELPGGWKFEFQEINDSEAKKIVIEQASSTLDQSVDWNKVATLFWIGNDLMWIQSKLSTAASPRRILQGINPVIQYMKDLGFDEKSFPIRNLTLAKTLLVPLVNYSPISDQNIGVFESQYNSVHQYIEIVKWYIDALAKGRQPDFEKIRAL